MAPMFALNSDHPWPLPAPHQNNPFAEMMERWFEYLYDFDVVPEDVFLQWEGDTEVSTSAEYPGKNSALIGAKQLLERLKTTEEEEDPQAP